MRPVEIRALTSNQLMKELEDAHQELMNLRFRAATKQLANTSEKKRARRNLARLETILRERQLQQTYRSSNGSDET